MRFVLPLVACSILVMLPVAALAQADEPAALGDPGLARSLPTWKLAPFDGIGANWGPAGQDGERAYRTALAGKQAVVTVPAWWGKAFRPAEGTVYNLRITYKDTATTPVIFSSHGGFARYWGLGEVHRFGGSGDGQWKVANVPVSWDLVCRRNEPFEGPGDVTEFGIQADKDLPVESIAMDMAGPDARERYNRETREWIARAQADKRAKASKGEKQQPVIPEALRNVAIVPYARTYLVPLMQNAAPQKGETGMTLKVRMARNEYEPAAFGVYANGQDLKGVTFNVSDLVDAKGNKLAAEIEMRTAEYAVVNTRGRRDTGEPAYLLYPQRLWPMYPVDIAKGESHWFWITVHTLGEKTRPGTYKGTVQVVAGNQDTNLLPIEVEVVPVTLLTMEQTGLELGGCSGQVPAQDLQCLAAHNHTGMDIWFGGVQPQMRVVEGKAEFDWTYLDDWMASARKAGMDHMMWFMGGDPYGFPDTVNLERDLYRAAGNTPDERNKLRREYIAKLNEHPEKVLPEVRPRYAAFIRDLAQHAKENNWPSRLIIHPYDEPAKWIQDSKWENPFHEVRGTGPWIKEHFKDACAIIREAAKGHDNIETGGDMHHATPSMPFLTDVDVFCTNAIHEDPQLNRHVTDAGVEFWQYSGTSDHTPAHQGRYSFGFFFGAYNARGSLIWAYDGTGRFDTSEGGGQWGYGWYTPFGTVYTPFMVGVREGFDDRRWVETYKKQVGFARAQPVLQPIDVAAIEQRTRGGRDTVYDFFAEMRRIDQLDQWRGQVIDAMLAAQAEKTSAD